MSGSPWVQVFPEAQQCPVCKAGVSEELVRPPVTPSLAVPPHVTTPLAALPPVTPPLAAPPQH